MRQRKNSIFYERDIYVVYTRVGPWASYLYVSVAKEGKVLEQKKNYCSLSWEPLREFTAVVLLFFPQVLLWRSTLLYISRVQCITKCQIACSLDNCTCLQAVE